METLNMSGNNDCPCCGTVVMCANEFVPELCDECKASDCDTTGPCPLELEPDEA